MKVFYYRKNMKVEIDISNNILLTAEKQISYYLVN